MPTRKEKKSGPTHIQTKRSGSYPPRQHEENYNYKYKYNYKFQVNQIRERAPALAPVIRFPSAKTNTTLRCLLQ
jgi:hypothetical protein